MSDRKIGMEIFYRDREHPFLLIFHTLERAREVRSEIMKGWGIEAYEPVYVDDEGFELILLHGLIQAIQLVPR